MQTKIPALTYWQQHLQHAPAMFTLATDKKRQAVTDNQLTRYTQALSTIGIEADTAVTHHLAAYLLLLRQHIQQDDLIIGTPIADQLLPLRVQVNPAHSFSQFVAEVTTTCTAAADNAVPLTDLVTALQPAYDDSYAPLFQLVFAKADTPVTSTSSVTEFNHLHDLTLIVEHTKAGWHAHWHYRADLFTEAHIERLALQYAALLQNIAQNQDAPIAELSAISADEFELMVHTWNQTALDFPQDLCLHEWIAQQMGRTPEKTAVSDENTTLTYAQLDTQSGQLAAFLQQHGVRQETVVAFYLPRTVNILVTLLGILKAGGTYLPLTADLPPERIQFMLDDARAQLVITDSEYAAQLPPHLPAIQLNTQWAEITAMQPLAGQNLPTDATAYIIYTSGSTGVPKGVPISHRNIVHLLTAMLQEPGMTADDKYLATTAFSFDILGYELYCPLLVGGEVVVASSLMLRDGHLLSERLARGDISFMQSTPVTWQMLLVAGWQGTPGLKMISCGEALTRHLATQLLSHGDQLWNLYGPTEATIFATGHLVTREELAELNRDDLPIGRPITNMETIILDAEHQLLPIGAVGELYLGGAGLSRGYLYREALTAERFIPHPFSDDPDAKLYRTGDLARYRTDGIIEYLGRTDYQVKINGLRIELGEIESRVQELAEVHASVATTWINPANNDKQLVVYFTSTTGEEVDTNKIRTALKQAIPNYMMPNFLIQLPQLPATPNGKVDRKALPPPNLEALKRDVPFEAPRSPVEEQLCSIWQSLLGISKISIHDSFLDLGAHSLQVTQLNSRILEQFNVKLLFRDIVDQGTIARIAQFIGEAQPQNETAPITRVDATQPIPVSFAQQRLLLIDQLTPDQTAYNVPLILQLDGALDANALQASFDALVARHDVLRTTFYYDDNGEPFQHISTNIDLPVTLVDLSHLPPEQQERATEAWKKAETMHLFSLTDGPLVRVSLLKLTDQKHLLAIVKHHVITDGWSEELLLQELAALYTAFKENKPSPLPPLPIQYADFAVWQRSWLSGDALQEQRNYWREQLQNIPATCTLPTEHTRPAVQSYEGAVFKSIVPTNCLTSIRRLAQEERASLFMVLLTTFQLLLARYTGQEDIVVGSPIANRNRTEVEDLIGFFVNMLVLRTNTAGNPSFRDLLAQVRHHTLEAHAHQDIPFVKLVEELQPTRDLSYSPLFQIVFILQNTPHKEVSLPELSLSVVEPPSATAKYDLTLAINESPDGLFAEWEYNTAVFDERTMERLSNHFNHLLHQVTNNPDLPIHEIDILTADDKQQMAQWNRTTRPFPEHLCLQQLISQQAARTPEKTAVSDAHTQLTYQQLEEHSNQVAQHLIALGVKPDTFVAIALERTVDMVVSLLGILKAGGAYLPLDPAYPAQRIEYMLADTQAPILLTQTSLLSRFPAHNAQLVCIDTEWETISQYPTTLPQTAVRPEHLAYIIYTSGSTGKPKGVQIRHRAVVNLLTDMQQQPGMVAADKLLAITTLSFDIATVELYLPLLVGAQVVIAPQEAQTNPDLLLDLLQKEAITIMQATPTTWQMLLNANWQGQPGLKMITGGEPLTVTMAQQLLARGETLWNMYAPSETTTYSTIQPVLPEELAFNESVSIGHPVANTQLYILDKHRQQVPIGVTGELYIGGAGVARGYLNQPDLTNERFIHHAFDNHEPIHLYATGDLASFRPDGTVNFLGRADHQVKIRGFRIELGEIEACLQQHTAVSQAVVHPYRQQLVAYLIFAENEQGEKQSAATADLRAFIQETLPAHMVPHIFMPVDAFPKTPNGKIDRRALPAPTGERDAATAFIAPRTPTEKQLAAIWQSLLNVDNVGIHDDFFVLGGHSLLATQLISRIRKAFRVNLPLRKVFEQATIAGLAYYLDKEEQGSEQASLFEIQPRTFPDDKLPLSLAQKRLWFFYKLNPNSASYNVPIALRLRGAVNSQWLTQSLLDVIARHEVLRTTYYEADDVYGRIQAITQPPITHINLRHLQGDALENEVMQRVEEEAKRPFTLTDQIPIRIQLLELADDHFVLLLTVHHIAIDLWSMDLLVQEVIACYKAYQENHAPDLAQLNVQYSDYAVWQTQWLAANQSAQEAYWQNTLTPNPAPLILPADKPRPQTVSEAGAVFSFRFSQALSAQTHHFMEEEKATLFMVLLAAYHALLHRYTGQREINVGSPIANRHHAQTENLIGMFVNTIVINATIDPQMNFRQLLHQVRQHAIGAQENQDLPFNRVVDLVQPVRDAAFAPVFQTFFTAQTVGNVSVIPGIQLQPIASASQAAKFDLTLSMTPQIEALSGFIEYKTDLFSEAFIEQFSQHYARLLTELLQNPELPLAEIDFRTTAEREQQTQAAEAPVHSQSLAERFAQIVARFADKTAVSTPATTLTYQQLDTQSNQVAHLLRQQGIAAGDTVSIYAAASPAMITAVFGILKAGGIFLPLNQDEPAAWQQNCLQSGQAKLLLYSQTAPEGLADWPQLAIETAVSLPATPLPIPTSGGIHLPHFGTFNTAELAQLADIYPIQPDSRVVHMAPFASHQAAHEIFATLLNGGTLFLAERTQLTKLSALYELFAQTHTNFAILPAALLAALDPQRVPGLQTAVCLEADISPTLWQKWAGRQRLHGHLSAASILPTVLSPVNEDEVWLAGLPTTAVSIQNEAGQRLPTGVVGELHLGAELQATGDQWCWLADGRIQFRQYHPTHTTTRGRYLHTKWIAESISQHPAIRECIVLADDNPCEKRELHAYIVAADSLDAAQLSQLAQEWLPKQLIPAHFHTIPTIPRNAQGSVDYLSLRSGQQQEEQQDEQANTRAEKQAQLSARRQNLSAKKQALLDKWQQKKDTDTSTIQNTPRQTDGKPIPVSFAQQRLLVLDQLLPNQATYNIPLALQAVGALDVAALQTAVNTLFTRHDSLRTTFYYGDDNHPYQYVSDETHLPITHIDFSHLAEEEQASEVRTWVETEMQRPFSLSNDTLIRVSLLRLAEQQHILVIVMHHIITDAWSINIFLSELTQLYMNLVRQLPPNLPEPAMQYADFAAWQRDWLTGDVLQQQLNYWKDILQDAPTFLTIPADRARPVVQSQQGATVDATIPAGLMSALQHLAQAEKASLFMVLLAAFQLLLARYTGQKDIVVGSPIANRSRPETENLIGFFLNMLVLRTDIAGDPSFRTLLSRVRNTTLSAYAHQDIPFEKLVEELQPTRDMSYSPLFQVAFTLRNAPAEQVSLPDLSLSALKIPNTAAKYDLLLDLNETPNGIQAFWEYSTALFDEHTIERLAEHFNHLLQQLVAQPDVPISHLQMLTAAEKAQMAQWNATTRPFPEQHCLHQLISQQAAQTPQRIAVSDSHTILTYEQLEAQSNQLAHHLLTLGVQPDTFVAIALPRTADMLVGLLGILKAGAAYLPLDPAFPAQRIQFMLADAQVPLLLTHSDLVNILPDHEADILCLDTLGSTLAQYPTTLPDTAVLPHHLAYIIYTSGSTGRPKGVQIHHRSVVNLLTDMLVQPGISSSDKLLAITTLSFDIASVEIYLPLLIGAQVVIAPQTAVTDPHQLIDLLQSEAITILQATPTTWQMLLTADWQGQPGLKMITGGEALTVSMAQQLLARGQTLWNMYAPSETTTYSTIWPVLADALVHSDAVPIGRPVANTQLYVLDRHLQPVPIGVIGELYIGGEGVSRGYLNQPELTAERFIQYPLSDDTAVRLYRTGDLASFRPDGAVNFHGRSDHQVKIRGFRIELGEIENCLLQHPDVAQAVVFPHQQQLVAYFIWEANASEESDTAIAELRAFVQKALPAYMVPHIFMPLDAFPQTPNGKVDRQALPDPSGERSTTITFVAARTPVEEQLVGIWTTLLKVDKVGVFDNFFELGGHSLLALELVAAIYKATGIQIPVLHIFQEGTIAAIADYLKTATAESSFTPVGDTYKNGKASNSHRHIPKRADDQQIPLSFAQQRLWFIEQLEATGASYNIPIYLQLNGPLDIAALEDSFNHMLARHESLRTRFVPDADDVPHQVVMPITAVSLPLTDLSSLPAQEKEIKAEKIRQQNLQTRFDLQNEPVYRTHILRLDDQTHQLLFTVHHVAFDAWSTGIFLREIVTHYLQKTTGYARPLPPVDVQYGDYTLWQQSQLTDEVLAQQLAFWRDHLADAPTAIELPTDKPHQQWQTSAGAAYEFEIPTAVAARVKQWTQAEQATLFMTLMTAFNGLLYRYTNQEDIVVGTPIANRNHPDLKNLIGFFLNTVALRAHIEATTTWQELLAQTRETMLAALAYQDYPFENLVQALLPDRDPSRHPLFQVMFVLQNQVDGAALPPGLPLTLAFVDTEVKTAKFDLSLHVQETAVGLAAAFEYNIDLFLPETIARMANHFQQMLADMVAHPEQPIFQAKLLTEREEKQIAAWNNTAMDVDTSEMIHHRFERQAAARPDAIAVEFGDEQLTYAQLEAQANQLAHFLRAKGIANNDLVGIMLPRSLAMVTAVLGTLKAGAGYVPLDPVYPPNRLEAMMQQADVKLLLSHSSLPKPKISCPIYDYDALDLQGYGRTPVQVTTDPEQIAYVIFTSGSTGIPKGVTLPHRALANMLAWQQQATHIKRPARTLQFTSLSFDVHFQEIFTTWQDGGTLVLIPDDVRRDGEQLLDYIRQHQIERLFLPFVALHNLAEAAEWQQSYPQSLQEVITAGEALQSTPPVRQFFTELSHCVLHNHYGPSESHVVTQYTLGADPAQWAALPPIGTPVANTQIHLLDANMKPVPISIPGELYIGGRNLALGYINQPDLTQERFIPDPFGSSHTGLLYKTGDLARYLPDGNIQFIGRNDFQVKIRGHRIELGEIEAVLNKHTAVEQAVVQAHKPDIGAHQLIAYIKTAQEDVIATLPAYLRDRLPAYMVPAHFVRLDAFPLTSSGKINRRTLPVPDKMEVVRSMPYAPPQTDLQQTLVQVWEEVLGVSPVGIHDNFFELGGHSLLALRLVAAMKKATGIKLPLPRLFQEGTIAAIAAYLDNPTAQTPLSPVVTLRGGNAEQQPLVLIHPGSGQVTPYLSLLRALPDSLPVYALQSLGLLPDTTAQTDIETMAATYLQALTAVSAPPPYHLAGWSMGGLVALEMAQQLTASGMPPASLTLIDTFAPDGKFTAPNDSVLLQWFAQDAGYLTPGNKPSLLADEAGIEAQLRHLWPQLQATGNIPPALTLQDVQQQFAVFRTNYAAMQAYRARPYSLPVHLIIAKASARSVRNRWLGWKPYLRKRSRLQLSATHFSLLHPPHVERISQEIMQTIQESSEVKR